MERYKEYKDSGIQWVGDIPSHWTLYVFKRIISERKAGCWGSEPSPSLKNNICLRIADFEYSKFKFNTAKEYTIRGYKDSEVENRYLKDGDVLIEKSGGGDKMPVGRAVLYNLGMQDVMYANFMEKLSTRENVHSSFLVFVLSCMYSKSAIWPYIKFTTGIQNLDLSSFLANEKIPIPPLSEQEKIVSYIESKTSKIDEYIAEKEKEVQLLNELKEAEIAKVVTQGLNSNVKMKECKTSLLGLIPEHWKERKMKYCFSERSEKNHPDEPILCATQSQGVIPQSMYQNRVVVVNKGFEGLKLVKVGDFVISLRSFEGGIEYAYYQGIISAAYTVLTPNNEECADYFKLLFKSYHFIQVLQTCVTGIREGQNINYQMLGRKYLPLPPMEEQRAIVAYINEKTAKVETLVSELEAEIDYLKEYKQRLIADCVTGQVNVQNEMI